ncbi:MAG: glycosyltransferase [Candidatus Glassbacteria bacterium]|nr:glycosyltransferase [Candidatus Glassbacteria bacterium]
MVTPVCVVSNAYPDFEGSSHGIFVRRSAEDMAAKGYFSHLVVPRIFKDSLPFEQFSGHSVRRFRFPSAQKLLIEYRSLPVFRFSVLLAAGTLAAVRTIRRRGCLLVHAHWAVPAGLIALAAARLSGRPLVVTVHGSDYRLACTRGGLTGFAFNRVVNAAERVVSVSGQITEYLTGQAGVPESSVVTCPMGADESIFNIHARAEPLFDQGFTVISTRAHLPHYRLADLLEAASLAVRRLPELRLVILGEGTETGALKELARRLGLDENRVAFIGRVEPGKLAGLLTAAGAYVSTSPVEGTSVSLLEAMACGALPVVADIPSNRAWVDHGENGLLFPPADTAALAEALVRAGRDRDLRGKARARGPEIVAGCGGLWSQQVETLDAIYRELLPLGAGP